MIYQSLILYYLYQKQGNNITLKNKKTKNNVFKKIDALAVGLQEFGGAVILVSHDTRLITEVECYLWIL